MAEIPEENNKALCELAGQLSLSDVVCPGTSPAKPDQTSRQESQKRPSPFGGEGTTPRPDLNPPRIEQTKPQKIDLPPVKQEAAKEKPTVYVDLGHCTSKEDGNPQKDEGFISDAYTECQVNKAAGRELISELKATNMFRVVTSWNLDSPPPLVPKQQDLQRRINVVNSDIAARGGDSIYISLHHDNDPEGQSGQCVYYAATKAQESMPLARSIQTAAWLARPRDNAPLCIEPDTRTHNGKLVGLRGVNTIGVLIEAANVSNPKDKQYMADPRFHRYEAQKIVQGIKNYFQLKLGTERPYPPNYYSRRN